MKGRMFLESVRSEGLAHISYVLGHDGKAAVIDPRRDCGEYIDIAYRNGATITQIFETHRHEDFVVGSVELARRTGAQIFHGRPLDFRYGNPVGEGERFILGDMAITVKETPGHTYESISLVLADLSFGDEPVAVFTGDTLFVSDVGRTDFFPDRMETAGLLYESIFDKLLPLGDHVILYPAHGAGSVCGKNMAERDFSTLGYERRHNRVLQLTNRDDFIRYKAAEHHYIPPYFRMMEKLNLDGSVPPLAEIARPQPLGPTDFARKIDDGALVLDARSPEAFAGAFIPGGLAIPLELIPSFAGYFLPYDREVLLVVQEYGDLETTIRYLSRLGYDNIGGFLSGGMQAWESSGRSYDRIPTVHVDELVRRIRSRERFTLLDLRTIDEVRGGRLPGSLHIYIGDLPDSLGTIPGDRPITTFCGVGTRATIAASILKRNGFEMVEDSLGSMAACNARGCPIVKEDG